jgi:hypothetical protein
MSIGVLPSGPGYAAGRVDLQWRDRSVGMGRGRLGTRRPIENDGSHQDEWAAIDTGLALDAPLTRHRMICRVAYGAGDRTATGGYRSRDD